MILYDLTSFGWKVTAPLLPQKLLGVPRAGPLERLGELQRGPQHFQCGWQDPALRRALKREDDPDAVVLPILRDVSNPWDMTKDGRSWFGHYFPELMRK